MRLGRWESDAIDRYISATTNELQLLSLSHQLHSRPGPSTSESLPGRQDPVEDSPAFNRNTRSQARS